MPIFLMWAAGESWRFLSMGLYLVSNRRYIQKIADI